MLYTVSTYGTLRRSIDSNLFIHNMIRLGFVYQIRDLHPQYMQY